MGQAEESVFWPLLGSFMGTVYKSCTQLLHALLCGCWTAAKQVVGNAGNFSGEGGSGLPWGPHKHNINELSNCCTCEALPVKQPAPQLQTKSKTVGGVPAALDVSRGPGVMRYKISICPKVLLSRLAPHQAPHGLSGPNCSAEDHGIGGCEGC